jgi:methyl-accepting chemotaxis protein
MAVQLAGITLPGPVDVLGTVRLVAEWGVHTVRVIGALPDRAAVLLDQIDKLIARMDDLTERADALIVRVDSIAASAQEIVLGANAVTGGAAGVIERASQLTDGAGAVVAQAEATSRGVTELLATYRPLAERAAPLARRFVDELSEQEVQAAIQLVDELPRLAEHMESDIMPILATLDRVGPDIHELLNVVKDLRQAINGIPGLAYFRRRGTVEPE